MQKFKTNLFLTFAILAALGASACVQQKAATDGESAAKKTDAEKAVSTTAANPQIEAAQRLIDKSPDLIDGYNRLAVGYIRAARETGDFSLNSKAEAAVNRALEIEPENIYAQKLKASLLLTFHRFQEGLEFAQSLQNKYPQDAFIYGVLTDANVELGNYQEAVDAVQKMVDLRPNMESYSRVSYVRSLHGESNGAIEMMALASRIADPSDKEARAWCLVHLGDEYFKIGKFAEAEQSYDNSLQVFPDFHLGLAGKGRARAALGDDENAAKFLLKAQERVPLTETVILLGDIYTKTGKSAEAKKQYDLAEFIEAKLGNIDQRRLALLWADGDTKLDEALEIAAREHAARKDIFTADIYAWTLFKKGNFAEAKKIMGEAMRLKTKDARFFYHAGMIEKSLSNKKAAKDFLNKALQTNPAFDLLQAEKARTALQELS